MNILKSFSAATLLLALLSGNSYAENPTVVLETSRGQITVELFEDKAPITVANFLQYVDSGFYNGTIFHRIIPGFMIQGGGFTDNMVEKPTLSPIKNEAKNGLYNDRGTLSMARTSDPDSATSQFFINVRSNLSLDRRAGSDGYAVFGRVTDGMYVVDDIVIQDTTRKGSHSDVPVEAIVINDIYRQADDSALTIEKEQAIESADAAEESLATPPVDQDIPQ
jgi:cyclophilin family peptidyl-prolyl cis-trans isomerase